MPTIIVNTPVRDLGIYRQLASMAKRLTRHGHVEMNISALAEKGMHEIPEGGSPWHEYAAFNPTPAKFFPDPMLTPFIPESFVARNRRLLLDKAQILLEAGLGAAFWSYEPNFLPEAFFNAHPTLRGPRTDHPRRSRREEFAPCVDAPESREMTTRMVQELTRQVPSLGTYFFKTNDAGPGLCWSDWQYSGANGPGACRHQTPGKRVRSLIDSIQQGARLEGRELAVHFTGNFSDAEAASIRRELPDNAYLRGAGSETISIGNCADMLYPVRGVLDLIGTLSSLQRAGNGSARTIFLDLRTFYDRSYETLEVTDRMIQIVDAFLARPAIGVIEMYERAREHCERWVGPDQAPLLFDAMYNLHEAIKYKRAALPRMSAIYGAVSLRYINRPLVVCPELLTPEEESHFLPHVFNVSHERARLDYIDVHGTRQSPQWMTPDDNDPRVWAVDSLCARLNAVASTLDSLAAPDWTRMAGAVRLYGHLLRSSNNFFAVQLIRDRNRNRFASPVDPPARAQVHPDGDLTILNELLRDELENTEQTLHLLRTHGLDILSHAGPGEPEDTFLLGSGIVAQIEAKIRIMRTHWRDAEKFFTTPNK
jgi:hypothetical protein